MAMFHESYYEHSCLVANEQDVLFTDIKGQGCLIAWTRWWHNLFLLSYDDERCRVYYTSSQAMRQERTRHFRKHRNRIHPLSKFSNIWTGFMLIILCTNRVLLHHNSTIIFGQFPQPTFFMGVVLEFFIIVDLFVSFKIGYIDHESRDIILNRRKGHMHFASTNLFAHVAGAIPVHVLLLLRYGMKSNCGRCKANKFVCSLKFVKILGLYRFYGASSFLYKQRRTYTVTYMLRFLRIGLIGMITMLESLSLNDTVNIWLMIVTGEIREGSHLEMVLTMKYLSKQVQPNLYWLCVEFSTICKSLLGYDSGMKIKVFYVDIIFGLFNCLLATAFFMWSLTECFAVVVRSKYAEDQVMSHKEKSLNLLRCRQLSDRISRRINAYYDFNMSKLRVFEKQNDLYQFLPSSLHREIRRSCYIRYLKRIAEFKDWPLKVLEEIVMLMRDEIFLESDLVADAWQPGEGLAILYVGVLAVYSLKNEEIGHLIDGDYFGEISLVTDKEIRTSSVEATTQCKILFIPKNSFRTAMRQYPDLFFEMRRKLQDKHKGSEVALRASSNSLNRSPALSPEPSTYSNPSQSLGDRVFRRSR